MGRCRRHDNFYDEWKKLTPDRVKAAARGDIHSDYALLADIIVAAEDATFQDVGHFAVGVTPGDGIFTTWSYRAGPGRAEAFLLNPQPLPARGAYEWARPSTAAITGTRMFTMFSKVWRPSS
jgi:hypothetical protein